MKQLETKFYSRQEIATELSVNIKDTNHFKRNVENKLDKWGYKYIYSRKGVEITYKPQTAKEKLIEIMLKDYNLDIQIDIIAFAYFLYAFQEIDSFEAMPWAEREIALKECYGVEISERTLRSWSSKLIKTGTFTKCNGAKIYWRTTKVLGKTIREMVTGDKQLEAEMHQYWDYRRQLIEKEYKWDEIHKELWSYFGCCYYACNFIGLSAFDTIGLLQEFYELIENVIKEERKYV